MEKIKKLPVNIEEKLGEVIEEWAEIYLPGKPALLGTAVYFSMEKLLIDKTNEIIEKF
jgi:hypothetical protein